MLLWTALAASAFLSVAGADKLCMKGWNFFQGSCYYVGSSARSYSDADLECWSENAWLAEISSKEENDFIKGLLGNALSNNNVTKAYIGAYLSSDNDEWLLYNEYVELPFYDWADPDWVPPPINNFEYCASMSKDKNWTWDVGACNKQQAYVCEGEPIDDVPCFQGSCYMVLDFTYYFSQIQKKCNEAGGNALEINSKDENNFIKSFLKNESIPRSAIFEPKNVWLGATDEGSEGTFRWLSTKEKIDYEDWSDGEPNNSGAGRIAENCVVLDALKDYTWNDVECTSDLAAVCEISTSSGITG